MGEVFGIVCAGDQMLNAGNSLPKEAVCSKLYGKLKNNFLKFVAFVFQIKLTDDSLKACIFILESLKTEYVNRFETPLVRI